MDQATYEEQIQANAGWNFAANLWDIGFLTIGTGLVSRETIMPLLVSELTDSKIAIGLIPAIFSLGFLLPQLLTANFTERLRVNKPFVMLLGGPGERGPYLLIGLAVLAFGRPAPILTLVLLLLLLAVSSASSGVANPAWYAMIAKVIPVERRGLWAGLSRSMGALLGIAGGLLSGRVLADWVFPQNYGYLFLAAFVVVAISWLGLAANREPPSLTVKPRTSLGAYLRQLPGVLRRDPNYVRFLISMSVASLGAMAGGFFMVYGKENVPGALERVGILTAALVGTQAVANLIWGLLADRRGHKAVLVAGALGMALTAAVAWWTQSFVWLVVTFVLYGISFSATIVSRMNIILEFCAPEDRPTYIGMSSTLLAPAQALGPVLGGWLATALDYRGMFLVALGLSLVGGVLLLAWVREPRRRTNDEGRQATDAPRAAWATTDDE
jgi:MFS family permease